MKVHHQSFSFEDGPVVYPANAFDSCLRGGKVLLRSSLTKSQKKWVMPKCLTTRHIADCVSAPY